MFIKSETILKYIYIRYTFGNMLIRDLAISRLVKIGLAAKSEGFILVELDL